MTVRMLNISLNIFVLSGAEHMCIVANERLFTVKLLKDKISLKSSQLEKDVTKIEVDTIERTMEAKKKRDTKKETESENEMENVTEIDLEKLTDQEIHELSEDNNETS